MIDRYRVIETVSGYRRPVVHSDLVPEPGGESPSPQDGFWFPQ